jgi:catechol 2,3-dioxygenase-like lactoylglutathione lyase family enzyme
MASITGLFHGGITVRDMDVALRFYVEGLGLEVHIDRVIEAPYLKGPSGVLGLDFDDIRVVYLRVPNADGFVELLEYRGLERLSAAARPCDFGAGHICFYVDDVDVMHEGLVAMGYQARSTAPRAITSGPNEGARSVYMRDPDGYPVELFQKPPGR